MIKNRMAHALGHLLFFLATIDTVSAQQKVIQLYNGSAPGSETWNWTEQDTTVDIGLIVSDVSHPSITEFIPSNPNGTAVIVAPGGGFHALAFDLEGTGVAKRLNAKGITVFVLKYRLVHNDPEHPENSLGNLLKSRNFKKLDSINALVIPLAMMDGLNAIQYVRNHASDYHIQPDRIGFMGFSAGGTLTMSVVYNATVSNRPNFVAPIYAYEPSIIGSTVPTERTPIFITAASDDDLGLATHSVDIYLKWLAAKQPAELHMYEKGKHGFGTRKQGLPVDTWTDRFTEWLDMHGLLKK